MNPCPTLKLILGYSIMSSGAGRVGSSQKRTDVRDTGKLLDPVGGEQHERKLRSLRF